MLEGDVLWRIQVKRICFIELAALHKALGAKTKRWVSRMSLCFYNLQIDWKGETSALTNGNAKWLDGETLVKGETIGV